jgi:hypothetical protein
MNLNKSEGMKTFILIHGSWHSAWNWHKVVPILQKKGHNAFDIDGRKLRQNTSILHRMYGSQSRNAFHSTKNVHRNALQKGVSNGNKSFPFFKSTRGISGYFL